MVGRNRYEIERVKKSGYEIEKNQASCGMRLFCPCHTVIS
jgi:hypothetical protein